MTNWITLDLPKELVERAKVAADRDSVSLSDYIAAALEEQRVGSEPLGGDDAAAEATSR